MHGDEASMRLWEMVLQAGPINGLPDLPGARQDQGEAEEERKEVMGPNWPVIGAIASIATVVAVPFGMWQHSLAAGAFAWVCTALIFLTLD